LAVGGVPFSVLRNVLLSVDSYKSFLSTFSGMILLFFSVFHAGTDPCALLIESSIGRAFSSHRLRVRLDRINASLFSSLHQMINMVFPKWSHIDMADPPFVDDPEAKIFWKNQIGAQVLMVEATKLVQAMREYPSIGTFTFSDKDL
jgi:hypothetical protein